MVQKFLSFLILSLLLMPLAAQQKIILAVSDFTVESDNPAHKYIGKGLSRLVAGELKKSKNIELIEREEIKRILQEQEFSLSDLSDSKQQIEIGKLVAAQYIIFGEVIDMGTSLLLSLRMVNTESGKIEWQNQITEKIETYDYIGAFFAQSILAQFNIKPVETLVQKIEKKEQKNKKAIVNISQGIDAFDRGDLDTAKTELENAAKIDPTNEVAAFYLSKLVTNTTKFKVNTEPFYSYQNPAFLGIIQMDCMHYSSGFLLDELFAQALYGKDHAFIDVPSQPGLSVREQDYTMNLGYNFPIGKTMGMGLEIFWALVTTDIGNLTSDTYPHGSRRSPLGFTFNFGWLLNTYLSIGIGLSAYSQRDLENTVAAEYLGKIEPFAASANFGLLIRNSDESFILDSRIGYSTGTTDKIVLVPSVNAWDNLSPQASTVFIENGLTLAFNQKKTFLVLKQLNDLAWDRTFYFGRLLPAVENYFMDWFSIRAGLEGSYTVLGDSTKWGYGVLGGLSFRVIPWGMDIDLNLTYRIKPSREIQGMMMPQFLMLLNLNFNRLWIKR